MIESVDAVPRIGNLQLRKDDRDDETVRSHEEGVGNGAGSSLEELRAVAEDAREVERRIAQIQMRATLTAGARRGEVKRTNQVR